MSSALRKETVNRIWQEFGNLSDHETKIKYWQQLCKQYMVYKFISLVYLSQKI